MMSLGAPATDQHSARFQLANLIGGYYVSQAIYVAARLKIADRLHDDPQTSDQLARATGTDARSLRRLLRALAGMGIFAEDEEGRFQLTDLAELLRSDQPGSLHAQSLCVGELHYTAFGRLLQCVETGRTGFDEAFGMPLFEYLATNRQAARNFDEALASLRAEVTDAMLDAYNFSEFNTLVDVGGGTGTLLSELLAKYRSIRGILFDVPHVIAQAETCDRITLIGGDFFESVPPGGDAYLLRHIIHDWDDEKAIRILKNCRRAMTRTSKLLLVESVIQPDNEPSLGKTLDLVMLAITGGMERTELEYRELLAASGFRLAHIIPTSAEIHVIEAEPK